MRPGSKRGPGGGGETAGRNRAGEGRAGWGGVVMHMWAGPRQPPATTPENDGGGGRE